MSCRLVLSVSRNVLFCIVLYCIVLNFFWPIQGFLPQNVALNLALFDILEILPYQQRWQARPSWIIVSLGQAPCYTNRPFYVLETSPFNVLEVKLALFDRF